MPLSDEERRVIEEIERQFSIDAARERNETSGQPRGGRAVSVAMAVLGVAVLGVGFAISAVVAAIGAALLFVGVVRIWGHVTEALAAHEAEARPPRLPQRPR
jgi:uncharacterized membrane protein HdeD (DUF308 family)